MENHQKNSILLVDDEKANLLVLNDILGGSYMLFMARTGLEAVEMANENKPDLILLDIVLPGMDGYEVLSILKGSEKTREIPVIFISGLSSSEDEMKGLGLGASDYISKPFSAAIVKLRVQNQLKIKDQMRQIIKKELAEKTNRLKNEFLSRMSHEMRTPINAIMGMINMIQNTNDREKINNYLIKAGSASHGLMMLTDNVLDIANFRDERLDLVNLDFDFTAMLQNTLDEVNVFYEQKHQTLNAEIDPLIPGIISGDRKRLSQAIFNLLLNASKFTGHNGLINFRAFVVSKRDDNVTIQIDVSDNGIGISQEQQKDIFAVFEQADGGIDRKHDGAGIGLFITKKIIEMMNGQLWVESSPGRGSKFSLAFDAGIRTAPEKTVSSVSLSGKTALLADDIEINREIVMGILEDTGMTFTCAVNGREAVELFSAEPDKYDVILMDINMPEMDGVEATRRIRALSAPEGACVPIFAITANTSKEEITNYLEAGMNEHIGKPMDHDELIRKMSMYIN